MGLAQSARYTSAPAAVDAIVAVLADDGALPSLLTAAIPQIPADQRCRGAEAGAKIRKLGPRSWPVEWTLTSPSSSAFGRGKTDRAGHPGGVHRAVTTRVLGQVLLVVGLGVVKLANWGNLGRDLAVARRFQL